LIRGRAIMFPKLRMIAACVALFAGLLVLATQTWAADPAPCLGAAEKAEAVAQKAAEASLGARTAVEGARASGTLEAARQAKEAAEAARDAAEEARQMAEKARSTGCLEAAGKAEAAAGKADKVAKEVEEEIQRIIKLLEGLKPAYLDPGTSEAERYQQEKDVSPSQ
jgi:hypothetical protein